MRQVWCVLSHCSSSGDLGLWKAMAALLLWVPEKPWHKSHFMAVLVRRDRRRGPCFWISKLKLRATPFPQLSLIWELWYQLNHISSLVRLWIFKKILLNTFSVLPFPRKQAGWGGLSWVCLAKQTLKSILMHSGIIVFLCCKYNIVTKDN